MEDKFVRYSKLYVLLFLLFLSVPVIIGLIIGAFYGISRLFSSAPIDLVYELFILSIPAAVFSAVYVIFFRRTAWHPVWPVRFISKDHLSDRHGQLRPVPGMGYDHILHTPRTGYKWLLLLQHLFSVWQYSSHVPGGHYAGIHYGKGTGLGREKKGKGCELTELKKFPSCEHRTGTTLTLKQPTWISVDYS